MIVCYYRYYIATLWAILNEKSAKNIGSFLGFVNLRFDTNFDDNSKSKRNAEISENIKIGQKYENLSIL